MTTTTTTTATHVADGPAGPVTTKPQLWRGGGDPSTGCLCAMQEQSWRNGEEEITAFPEGVDNLLALMVQEVNDHHCTHADGRLVCEPCSDLIRTLASRTQNTSIGDDPLTCTIYVAIARRLGIDDPDLHRRGGGHPHLLALETLEQLNQGHVTLEMAHTVIDWWRDLVRVRTGRTVGHPRTKTTR